MIKIEELQKVCLEKDDVLLVKANPFIKKSEVKSICDAFKKVFPYNKMMIIHNDMTLYVVDTKNVKEV